MSAPDGSFACVADGGALLAASVDAALLERFRPSDPTLASGLSEWDRIQQGADLDFHQSDCAWFAFDARTVDGARRFSGIVALHRTGPRLARLGRGFNPAPVAGAPRSLASFLSSPLLAALPIRPEFDRRPLFLAVLFDHQRGGAAEQCEVAVEGAFDPESFSLVSGDRDQQLLQGASTDWQPALPPILQSFFHFPSPAFALRAKTPRFELELFLRPEKNPVAYGPGDDPALRSGRTTIHYVQRPRLDALGMVRRRGVRGSWEPPVVIRGDATQDRHWMTVRQIGLRWTWFMARLDDGRDCMAYEIRSAGGGRNAPSDAGTQLGGGAWIVGTDGKSQPVEGWKLVPEQHRATFRGLVPSRLRVELPSAGLRLTVEAELATFVPTRALGELVEAGIWESPARLVDGVGVSGGRFWLDVMPAFGGV